VAIGATLVGSVRVTFDDLRTNRSGQRVDRVYTEGAPWFAKGDEWGRFEFGSTIVMIAAPGQMVLEGKPPGSRLRIGERIGTLGGRRD
jgi:phosphatidylserine decarboxylase